MNDCSGRHNTFAFASVKSSQSNTDSKMFKLVSCWLWSIIYHNFLHNNIIITGRPRMHVGRCCRQTRPARYPPCLFLPGSSSHPHFVHLWLTSGPFVLLTSVLLSSFDLLGTFGLRSKCLLRSSLQLVLLALLCTARLQPPIGL